MWQPGATVLLGVIDSGSQNSASTSRWWVSSTSSENSSGQCKTPASRCGFSEPRRGLWSKQGECQDQVIDELMRVRSTST